MSYELLVISCELWIVKCKIRINPRFHMVNPCHPRVIFLSEREMLNVRCEM